MTESNFRKHVIKFIEDIGNTYVVRVEGLARGTSDLIINYQGRFVAIELKGSTYGRNKNKSYYDVTEAQKIFLNKQQKCGGIAFVLKHSEVWKQELIEYLEKNREYKIDLIDWDNL